MEIWQPKPPGTLWATPGLLWDSFTFFYLYMVHTHTTFCTVIVIRTNHSYLPHQSSKQLLCYFLVNMIVVLAVW